MTAAAIASLAIDLISSIVEAAKGMSARASTGERITPEQVLAEATRLQTATLEQSRREWDIVGR